MRSRRYRIPAITRTVGYLAVAAAIAATALHLRHEQATPAPSVSRDPLGAQLARCQAIGMAAMGDRDCEAAWAENRRHFFGDTLPGGDAAGSHAAQSPAGNPKER